MTSRVRANSPNTPLMYRMVGVGDRVKGFARQGLNFEAALQHYNLKPPAEVESISDVATAIEQLRALTVRQLQHVSALLAEYYAVPAHQTFNAQDAVRKTSYAYQEAAFEARPELAQGRTTARNNAKLVFALPDVPQEQAPEGAIEEGETMSTETTVATPETAPVLPKPKRAPKSSAPAPAKVAKSKLTKADIDANTKVIEQTKKSKAAAASTERASKPSRTALAVAAAVGETKSKAKSVIAKVEALPAAITKAAKKADPKPTTAGEKSQRGAGTRAKEFTSPITKRTYDLSNKGFGMLGVIAVEFKKALQRASGLTDEEVANVVVLLQQRDSDCGKGVHPNYVGKAKGYIRHAAKHLSGECQCPELFKEFIEKPPIVKRKAS